MAHPEKKILPKIRRSWLINPKPEVKPTGKIYGWEKPKIS